MRAPNGENRKYHVRELAVEHVAGRRVRGVLPECGVGREDAQEDEEELGAPVCALGELVALGCDGGVGAFGEGVALCFEVCGVLGTLLG